MLVLPVTNVKSLTNDLQIEPRYVASCPGGGKHYMRSIGVALMFDGTSLENRGDIICQGTASKCDKCKMMAFTEYYPGKNIRQLGLARFDTNTYSGVAAYVCVGPYTRYTSLIQDDFIAGFEWA